MEMNVCLYRSMGEVFLTIAGQICSQQFMLSTASVNAFGLQDTEVSDISVIKVRTQSIFRQDHIYSPNKFLHMKLARLHLITIKYPRCADC